MKCKCCNIKLEEIEKKYGIKIFEIKYFSPTCGTAIESRKTTKKGIGFRKWVKSLCK